MNSATSSVKHPHESNKPTNSLRMVIGVVCAFVLSAMIVSAYAHYTTSSLAVNAGNFLTKRALQNSLSRASAGEVLGRSSGKNTTSSIIFDPPAAPAPDPPTPIVATAAPSAAPTAVPTEIPTEEPTKIPTEIPTEEPTKIPTEIPSQVPSNIPSAVPSNPTNAPTLDPTLMPSAEPTAEPTRRTKNDDVNYYDDDGENRYYVYDDYVYIYEHDDQDFGYQFNYDDVYGYGGGEPERPTKQPSFAPTIAPTAKPTAVPSAHPTRTPTRVPTAFPTFTYYGNGIDDWIMDDNFIDDFQHDDINGVDDPPVGGTPTKHPTVSPTRTPTNVPTRNPTTNPTIVPTNTLSPTAVPTTISPTTASPTNPTVAPTLRPSSTPTAAPTVDTSAPEISVLVVRSAKNSISVRVSFTKAAALSGTVYCAALSPSTELLGTQQVITASTAKAVAYLAGAVGVNATITGVVALTPYTVYCTVVSSSGMSSSLLAVQNKAVATSTGCCKDLTFTNAPSIVYGSLEQYSSSGVASTYVFTYSLSAAPTGTLRVSAVITTSNNAAVANTTLAAIPSSTTFTASGSLNGRFVLSGPASTSGSFKITLTPSGGAGSQYSSAFRTVSVLSTSSPKPAPSLISAKFASSGSSLFLFFNYPTNKGDITASQFACSQLSNFTGSSAATCSWVNNSAVRVVLGASSTLAVNAPIFIKAGILKAQCTPSECAGYTAAATQWVPLSAPDSPVAPTVVLTTPALMSPCDNVTIDASSSTGSGGCAWSSVVWTAQRAAGPSVVSDTSILALLNARGSDLSAPIVLPRALFSAATYTITLTLTNFLGSSMSATAVFGIASNPNLPIVTIQGPSTVTITPAQALQIYGSSRQASCAERSSTISYKWVVTQNGVTIDKPSTSSTPTKYTLSTYSLSAGSVYTVTLEATAKATSINPSITARAAVTVQVTDGVVVASIAGGAKRAVPAAGTVTLDASSSTDQNKPKGAASGLSFKWTCTLSTAAVLGQNCDSVLPATTTNAVLQVDVKKLDTRYLYDFQVTATASDGRSDVAVVTVELQPDTSTYATVSAADQTNANAKVTVTGTVTTTKPPKVTTSGGNARMVGSWSASTSGQKQSITTLTPNTASFSYKTAQESANFPLVIPGNSLTAGSTVTFRLTTQLEGENTTTFTEVTMRVNAPPSVGTLQSLPASGEALSTIFTSTAAGWSDDPADFPLSYQFQYRLQEGQASVALQSRGAANTAASQLPAGLDGSGNAVTIICTVYDTQLASNTATSSVVVSEKSDFDLEAYVNDENSKFDAAGDVDTVSQMIGNAGSVLNKVNCSLAAPATCTAYNREPCADTAQTCGPCLEGYVGLLGDHNDMCVAGRRRLDGSGFSELCDADGQCISASCTSSMCSPPPLLCPTETAEVCSGHGRCNYTSFAGAVIDHVCTVAETDCRAHCVCHVGYSGAACALTTAAAEIADQVRGQLCEGVITVANLSDPSPQLLSSLFGLLDTAFDPFEVVSEDSKASCKDAMNYVGGMVRDHPEMVSELSPEDLDLLLKTVAKFIPPPSAEQDPEQGKFLHDLLEALDVGILESMVAGQEAYSYATEGMRTILTKIKVGGRTAISPPRPANEEFYQDTALESYIEVPAAASSGLLDDQGYLALAVTLWRGNPFPNSTNIESSLLRIENHHAESNRRLTVRDDDQKASSPDFYVVLQFNQQQDFDFSVSMDEAASQGLDTIFPHCVSFDGTEYTSCSGCTVSAYTNFNVTFACTLTAPSTSSRQGRGGLVGQYGVRLGVAELEPTQAPTSSPGESADSKDTNNEFVAAVTVGAVGGVLALGILGGYWWTHRKRGASYRTVKVVPGATEP